MATPTAPQVVMEDRAPGFLRPGNQARLLPAMPAGHSAVIGVRPRARNGNDVETGLGPGAAALRAHQGAPQRIRDAAADPIKKQEAVIAQISTELVAAPPEEQPVLRRQLVSATKGLSMLKARKIASHLQPASMWAAPWERRMQVVRAPATSDPLALEPAGASTQTGQALIQAVQAQVAPSLMPGSGVSGITDTMAKVGDWMKASSFGIPNWALAAVGAGAAAGLFLFRR